MALTYKMKIKKILPLLQCRVVVRIKSNIIHASVMLNFNTSMKYVCKKRKENTDLCWLSSGFYKFNSI